MNADAGVYRIGTSGEGIDSRAEPAAAPCIAWSAAPESPIDTNLEFHNDAGVAPAFPRVLRDPPRGRRTGVAPAVAHTSLCHGDGFASMVAFTVPGWRDSPAWRTPK